MGRVADLQPREIPDGEDGIRTERGLSAVSAELQRLDKRNNAATDNAAVGIPGENGRRAADVV